MILFRDGDAIVDYHDGVGIDPLLSPRPYLTAVSRSGVAVTDVEPADHPHHLGLSAALPDVDGCTFWGGRTFVRDRGSTLLSNHGTQHVRRREVGAGRIEEHLDWCDPHGRVLLAARRLISTRSAEDAVQVVWVDELTADAEGASFGSPQTNGREGAFYGGLFWRTPFPAARVRCADGEGADAAHGSSSPWLCIDGPGASLVATTSNGDMPWFVRAEGYVGFGPAVAVDRRRALAAGETLRLDLAVSILDAPPADPAAVAERLRG